MPRKQLRLSFSYENPLQTRLQETFFKELPTTPGIYLMRNHNDEILYIGKAKSLRNRVSSYRRAKPGHAPENILEMLNDVSRITWEEHVNEDEALRRELELIQAVRPPFNIAANWSSAYFFIGLRYNEAGKMHFRLTSRETTEPGEKLYGCYKHRRLTKSGYTALLRLLHAAQTNRARFSFPAKITRTSPPYSYVIGFKSEWHQILKDFLSGKSRRFLQVLTEALLENENIPPFVYAGLQHDLLTAREFYRVGPNATRKLKLTQGITRRLVSHRLMDKIISGSVSL